MPKSHGVAGVVGRQIGRRAFPQAHRLVPGITESFIYEALDRAIRGVGPLTGARAAADKALRDNEDNVDRAILDLIKKHMQYAGAQGFATNIGGLVTAVVSIPVNLVGLTVIQSRMIAAIAHLRGYDVDDGRVRNAILTCLVGEDAVKSLVKKQRIPAPPMALATAPRHDPTLEQTLAAEVTSELITRLAGKRVASTVGRRVPVVGGVVGAGTDAFATWQVGRYASRELLPRARR